MMKQLYAFIALSAALATPALRAAEATDTVRFDTRQVVLEDDPKRGQYNFSLYSDDGQWKVQLNYHAEASMFGTFGNDDFGLSTTGRYYNYARNPKNDMVFYSFTDMDVTVSDRGSEYHVSANCLASNQVRFLIEGSLDVLVPTDTVCLDLGYAQRVDNAFYGTHTFTAEDDTYRLAYGVVADDPVGTFYTADILMPELMDKRTGERVGLKSATAVHRLEADTLWLTLDALGDDLTLYRLTMYNAAGHTVQVVAEEDILIEGDIALQDLTEMYGCYQLSGQNRTWGVGIAFVPDALAPGRREWTMEDLFMPYTTLVRLADQQTVRIHDVRVWLVEAEADRQTFRADITSLDGVLYHVTLKTAGPDYLGEPDAVVEMDLGQVALLDYSEPGVIGLGAYEPMQYQLRLYLKAHRLEGDYYTDDAVMDRCDVMVVRPSTGTFVFHDAARVNTHFQAGTDGVTHVTVDMLGVDNVLYHATFSIPRLRSLADATYSLDEALMVALREEDAASGKARYTLQFQRLPDDADDLEVITEGEIFSFAFTPGGEGIGGDYGYSAGTLAGGVNHTLYEQGTELRLSPVAGTLSLKPVRKVTLLDGTYHTTLYEAGFQFVAQNSVIYEGRGTGLLLCIDPEGELVEVDEPALSRISQQLAGQGLQVQKVCRGGRLMIVTPFKNNNNDNDNEEILYTVDGKRLRQAGRGPSPTSPPSGPTTTDASSVRSAIPW